MELKGLTYTYPGGEGYALRDVDFLVRPGECHIVTGPTGSGKSTLALALGGMLPGEVRPGGHTDAGVVLQNPQTQLLASSIGAEAAFGLENLCVQPGRMPGMVRDALRRAGLDKPLGLNPRIMSMGEKYRLLIAAQLVMGRKLIVLDEPSGQLDGRGIASLVYLVRDLKEAGVSFVVCEHRPEAYVDVTDFLWRMEKGRITPAALEQCANAVERVRDVVYGEGRETVVSAEGLVLSYTENEPKLWGGMDLEISAGMSVAVAGPNGIGKTSLLRCISGSLAPTSGRLSVLGGEPSLTRLRGRVGLMPQNPDAQLFEDTVHDEVSFTMRRLGFNKTEANVRVRDTLDSLNISGLAGRSPHGLSYGQKRLVCLAALIAARPDLLLLDSPMTGLDTGRRDIMLDALDGYTRDGGTVIATSHDAEELLGWPDVDYSLAGGASVAQNV